MRPKNYLFNRYGTLGVPEHGPYLVGQISLCRVESNVSVKWRAR